MLYIVVITILFSLVSVININNTSALSYQSSVGVGFTFLPTLNVSLSSDNLTINNLVPGGNAESSNVVTVNVSTNIAEGYNLYATVGNSTNETTSLTNASNDDYAFTSLSSNIPNLSSFTNNTWGYSYSLDSGATWISGDYDNASTGYNGLPLYTNTGIKLVEEADNTSSTVDFKIAARASNTQPSGEYTNVINFTVISNTIPTTMLDAFIASGAKMHNGYFKMQDMTPTICKSIDTDGEKGMQLIDVRDDKVYWVAKLKDGNCWMTQNLDFDIDATRTYTHNDTDLGWDPDSFDSNATWKPDTTNGKYNLPVNGTSVPDWSNQNNYPYSADPGDVYYYTSNSTSDDIKYTSLSACITAGHTGGECKHYHAGNYYNWTAAIASNNSSSLTTKYTNAPNSICPAGWRLPIATNANKSVYEFGDLLYVYYNITTKRADDLSVPYATGGFNKIRSSPLWFARPGHVGSGGVLKYTGGRGNYWSSVVHGASGTLDLAYFLLFNENAVYPAYYSGARYAGWSVRCVIR